MEIRQVGKWNLTPNTEVYYDKVFKHYITRKDSVIEIIPLYTNTPIQILLDKSLKDIYSQKFLQLRVMLARNLISILTEDNQMVRVK
jgi:hypothetical protein